jgi:GNAT superfamily N-acetyltransferase
MQGSRIRLAEPRTSQDWSEARRLIEAYAAELNVDLCFQNFAHELEHLPSEYGAPAGAFLFALHGAQRVGCVGLRRQAKDTGEMKRLYVVPAARGLGAGRALAEAILEEAVRLGYARVVLDTLATMKEAHALYASLGFRPTTQYRANPIPGAAFLEKTLRGGKALAP